MTELCPLCGSDHLDDSCTFLDSLENHEDSKISPEFAEYLEDAWADGLEILGRNGLGHALDDADEAEIPSEDLALILRPCMALAPIYHVPPPTALQAPIFEKCEEKTLIKDRFHSLDQQFEAYDFQKESLPFIRSTNYCCLIGDKMGLGKTVQALLALANDLQNDKHPSLIVVKSATIWQWLSQYKIWKASNPLGIFMIQGSKNFIPSGFGAYVISMDTLTKMVEYETDRWGNPIEQTKRLNKWFDKISFKSIIVDECHSFKNASSKRSIALESIIELKKIKYKIFLSGTAIKNRADEYWFTLHQIFPDEPSFKTQDVYRRVWCERDEKNKFSHIKEWKLDGFRTLISSRVLRRETGKDLPPFRRTTEVISISDPNFKTQYNKELEKLQQIADSKDKLTYRDVMDNLMVLRRIVGNAKVEFAVDYVDSFLDENENDKIVIGVHHHSVRDVLYAKLIARGHKAIKLSGEESAEQKNTIVTREFPKPENRVLIVSVLAGGTGIDGLQHCCSNVLMLERQWNSADEEQFEFRFNRDGQKNPVLVEYMIARGTIDDFFSANVERTRRVFGETISNNWQFEEDERSVRDVVEETLRNKL